MNRLNLKMVSLMKSIIERRENIHEYDLIDEMDMRVPTFALWKSYLIRRLDGFIEYEKSSKMYRWIE
jgi:hypothetical protein